jgi:polysaccharide biosynthesis protein PslA
MAAGACRAAPLGGPARIADRGAFGQSRLRQGLFGVGDGQQPLSYVDVNLPRAANRFTMERRRMRLYGVLFLADLAAVAAGFVIGGELRGAGGLSVEGIPIVAGVLPLYTVFALICEAYSVPALQDVSESTRRALAALGATSIILVTFAFFAQLGPILSRLAIAYAVLSSAVLIVLGRAGVAALIRWRLRGVVTKSLLIVDGVAAPCGPDCDMLDIGDGDGTQRPDLTSPTRVAQLSALLEPYDKVYLSAETTRRDDWITALKATGIAVELVVPESDIYSAVGLGRLEESDTLILSHGPLSYSSQVKKRAFDLALTVPALVFLAPLLAIVAIAIKLDSPGPVLFGQTRIGRGNLPFKCWKFRSMHVAQTDADGAKSASRGDSRITRVGGFIRKTSIDELPQLFNVLIGNMSLVGPRPHAVASTAGDQLFWEVSQRYWMRHASKPGITGLAQIRGFRGATEKPEDLEMRLRSDLEYLQNWSFWRDLVILFATVRVIRHENAY